MNYSNFIEKGYIDTRGKVQVFRTRQKEDTELPEELNNPKVVSQILNTLNKLLVN
jgi:hypothetical protein